MFEIILGLAVLPLQTDLGGALPASPGSGHKTGLRARRRRAKAGAERAAWCLGDRSHARPIFRGDTEALRLLADYVIARHYPECTTAENAYRALLDAVVTRQADLIARWMLIGFIHGGMNTDNTSIAGETIDYCPCAFMDAYDPATVVSSIDHAGRYAYGNQPGIAQWKLARFAETLLLDIPQRLSVIASASKPVGEPSQRPPAQSAVNCCASIRSP